MVDAAEHRKAVERRQQASIMAVAFNDPKKLDDVAPKPKLKRPPAAPDEQFVTHQWWPDG